MRWSPRVTVAAVITDTEGRHLLVEESPEGTPVFNQPAGHLEANETLLDAVCREVYEETCRTFEPQGLVGIYQWVAPSGDTYLRFCFHGVVEQRVEDCDLDPDISATHWLDQRQIENNEIALRSPMVKRCILDFVNGSSTHLDCLHDMASGRPPVP